jgi:hypothetical protein
MSRLMPVLTAILVVGAFAAFFVSFLVAPFAVLALLYGGMILAARARANKKRQKQTPSPVMSSAGGTPGSATHHDQTTKA